MTDLLTYDRSAHSAACPCNDCTAFDAAVFHQEFPAAATQWRQGGAAHWIAQERQRDLNWTIEPGHCILCGGTSAHISDQMEHYQRLRHNTVGILQRSAEVWFTSLLLHKAGAQIAVYKKLILVPNSKPAIANWSCLLLELNPEKCFGVASKEHEQWLEIRLGFKELEDESWDQRLRRIDRASRRASDRTGTDPATERRGGQVQGIPALAG